MTESLITTRGLGKTIGSKTILRDVSVAVSPGTVVGIIGKNGAGKTTLLEILLGFSPASSGTAQLFGHDSFTLPAAIRGRIGFVPQQDELVNPITGRQQLALIAALQARWNHELIDRLQSAWEVPLDQTIQELSGGERQKLSILLALGHEPDVLLLDEPMASLDPVSRRQFLQEIIEIASAQSRTVLFSTHIISDLERIADQIWIVRRGTVAWAGPLDDLKESVVRLTITSRAALPATLPVTAALSQQVAGQRANAVVMHWSDAEHARLRQELDADIEVEPLSLEDIFVEFHK
ncbi:MAG TPA: ABC transporter ATP-binding protein [Steroidobacteraceae bacterium]|nr:ABC transporter ATP-binding protein [Steroidobacteraceae bacterium]